MTSYFLPSFMSKRSSRSNSLVLFREPVKEEANSEFKPALLRIKIDLMSHLTIAEGLGKYIYTML